MTGRSAATACDRTDVVAVDFKRALVADAAEPYRAAGRFAWHFACGKLGRDPLFPALLKKGVVPDRAHLLDLGCGQGLLASWLLSAARLYEACHWPAGWPPPPRLAGYRGIELMPRDVERGRRALADRAEFVSADVRHADLGRCDVAAIFDVLHYFDVPAQDELLQRVADALSPGGVLLLRVGDASGGIRFRISNGVDHLVTFLRGHRIARFCCRSLPAWLARLSDLGFVAESLPMSAGTPFANVLLIAKKPAAARR